MDIQELVQNLQFSNIFWQLVTPLIFSLADIITGFIQAVINNNVESSIMRKGLLHKILIVLIIILSFVIDLAFNFGYFSKVVCIYVIFMELMSITENISKAGIDIGNLTKILKKGDEKGNVKNDER